MLATSSNGKSVTEKKLFSRETALSIDIQADKSIIWALLTNAGDFARWNSTIISIILHFSENIFRVLLSPLR